MRGVLVTAWHVWGFGAAVLLASALAAGAAPWILAGGAAAWLVGLLHAAHRRRPTVVPRTVGIFLVALGVYVGGALTPGVLAGGRPFLTPPGPWVVFAGIGFAGMLVVGALAMPCLVFARIVSRAADDRGRTPRRRWAVRTIVFPCGVMATALLTQFHSALLALALSCWAVLWLRLLLRESRAGESVFPRVAGLGVVFLFFLAWPPVSVEGHRDDIVAAVVLDDEPKGTFFLSVDGRDADADLLARLSASGIRARPASAARVPDYAREGLGSWITDRDTGVPGTRVVLSDIRRAWEHPCAVAVRVRWTSGPLSGHGSTVIVVWLGGRRWKVVQEHVHWVS